MKIFIGADHAGYELKEKIKRWLTQWGYKYEDMGAYRPDPDDDYPDFVLKVAQAVASDLGGAKGIVLGNSGQGEAIAANKIAGIRAAVYYGGPEEIVKLSRKHNDANILSLGATFLDGVLAEQAIRLWLQTSFSNEARHRRRLNKIERYEESGKI